MQNLIKFTFIFLTAFILASCLKQSESITPIAEALTLAQLQREAMLSTALVAGNSELSENAKATIEQNQNEPNVFYLNLKYNIKDFDVYETADIPNSFEKISHSFLKTFIKIFLKIKGSQTVEIDPVEIDLPNLNLDFDVIKSIRVKKVYIEYNKEFDQSVNGKASFSFVKSLNFNRIGKNKSLLFSYDKSKNNCQFKCLDFSIPDGNIIDLIQNNSQSIILKPTLAIGSLPKVTELKLDALIELQIGLQLPF